jgi:hypothetical protein
MLIHICQTRPSLFYFEFKYYLLSTIIYFEVVTEVVIEVVIEVVTSQNRSIF